MKCWNRRRCGRRTRAKRVGRRQLVHLDHVCSTACFGVIETLQDHDSVYYYVGRCSSAPFRDESTAAQRLHLNLFLLAAKLLGMAKLHQGVSRATGDQGKDQHCQSEKKHVRPMSSHPSSEPHSPSPTGPRAPCLQDERSAPLIEPRGKEAAIPLFLMPRRGFLDPATCSHQSRWCCHKCNEAAIGTLLRLNGPLFATGNEPPLQAYGPLPRAKPRVERAQSPQSRVHASKALHLFRTGNGRLKAIELSTT